MLPRAAARVERDEIEVPSFDRKDSVAMLCAVLAVGAIASNALFLQRGPHPAPILSHKVGAPVAKPAVPVVVPVAKVAPATAPAASDRTDSVVLPRSRPAEIAPVRVEPVKPEPARSEIPKPDMVKPDVAKIDAAKAEIAKPEIAKAEVAKAEPAKYEPASAKAEPLAPLRPIRVIPVPESTAAKAPDPIGEIIAPPARRVSAVQRVLSDYGYGQIKPTGTFDRDTQDAIEQFERAKKLPVTRQITPVLMRELAVLAGRSIE